MPTNAQELYDLVIRTLSPIEQLRLANLILNELVQRDVSVVDQSDTWTEQDQADLANYSLQFPDEFQALIDCLANNQWEEANRITERLDKSSRNLLILDELWTQFSHGRFGFSIQSQIWQEVGGFINPDPIGNPDYYGYGWETGDNDHLFEARDRYLNRIGCGKFDFSLNAPPGHLPFGNGGSLEHLIYRFSRIVATKDET